jgi:predicted anti-sigma-YlaC factor YlaD
MRDCEPIRESLGRWLDGDLSTSDAEVIRLHLESCAACDGERRQLEKLQSSLKSVLVSNVPRIAFEPFWAGVRERITKKPSRREAVMEWARSTFTAPALAWTVPAVIVVLLGVFSLDSLWKLGAQRNNFAAVESIDAHGRNVALLREDETKTTVIWLYQNQEGEDEPAGENTETSPSF